MLYIYLFDSVQYKVQHSFHRAQKIHLSIKRSNCTV